jgi:hypothetical protein
MPNTDTSEYEEDFDLDITMSSGKVKIRIFHNDPVTALQALYKVARPEYLGQLAEMLEDSYEDEEFDDE